MRFEVQQIFQKEQGEREPKWGWRLGDYMNDVVLKLRMGMDCDLDPGRNGNTICCVCTVW